MKIGGDQERYEHIVKDRDEKKMTWSELGEKYGISAMRVKHIYDKQTGIAQRMSQAPDNSIYRTELSIRTVNALLRSGINTVEDLRQHFSSYPHIEKIKGLSDVGIEECRKLLGLEVKTDVKIYDKGGNLLLTVYDLSCEVLSDTEIMIGKTRLRFEQPVVVK